ncbi:IS630 family transposase, partial [Insolitispirillum peregrinum]
ENVWQYLRQNALSHLVWESYEDIVDACCKAWNDFIATPSRIRSIASRQWTSVNG